MTSSSPDLLGAVVGAPGDEPLRVWSGTSFEEHPWSDVPATAERVAGALRADGVEKGGRVGVVMTNTRECIAGLLGGWWAGAAVASLPVPARGTGAQEYGRVLTAAADQLGLDFLMVDAALAGKVRSAMGDRIQVRTWQECGEGPRAEPDAPSGDEVAFIQYSSGSTGTPKGCVLSANAIAAQLGILDQIVDVRSDYSRHRLSAWIPLSHDMGFFACLLWPLSRSVPTLLGTPERFVRAPGSWVQDAVDWGATITVGPPSALALATRMGKLRPPSGELSLERWVLAAERVEWDALVAARDTFGPYGLPFEALMPAYGLAEAAAAVTGTSSQEEPRKVCVDGDSLGEGTLSLTAERDGSHAIVSVGRTPAEVAVKIEGSSDVGEIVATSPSLAGGYLADPRRSAERFRDGALMTGDLGFSVEDELFVVGRLDDVIIVAGRNVHAEEVELEIGRRDGVRERGALLIDPEGDRGITLVAETSRSDRPRREIALDAAAVAMQTAGVPIESVVFVRGGSLPRTPSGKLQRFRCRELLRSDRLSSLENIQLRGARQTKGAD